MDSTLINSVGPYVGTLISGGVMGFAAGYFLKKIVKILLFVGGAIVALLSVLAWQKMIIVDWSAVQQKSNEVATQAVNGISSALNNTNNQLNHSGLNHIDLLYPVLGTSAFLPCFIAGFMRG